MQFKLILLMSTTLAFSQTLVWQSPTNSSGKYYVYSASDINDYVPGKFSKYTIVNRGDTAIVLDFSSGREEYRFTSIPSVTAAASKGSQIYVNLFKNLFSNNGSWYVSAWYKDSTRSKDYVCEIFNNSTKIFESTCKGNIFPTYFDGTIYFLLTTQDSITKVYSVRSGISAINIEPKANKFALNFENTGDQLFATVPSKFGTVVTWKILRIDGVIIAEGSKIALGQSCSITIPTEKFAGNGYIFLAKSGDKTFSNIFERVN